MASGGFVCCVLGKVRGGEFVNNARRPSRLLPNLMDHEAGGSPLTTQGERALELLLSVDEVSVNSQSIKGILRQVL